MKYVCLALLVLINPIASSAQKDIFWGDGGMSLARLYPGASITYNYNVLKFLGLGAGAQLYDFHATEVNFQPVPALFWDVRFTLRARKKSQYLLFLQSGINIYKRNTGYWTNGFKEYSVQDDNGVYSGFGIGYFRAQTARGWGHYVTVKMISNSYEAKVFNTGSGERTTERLGDATLVVSFGYKF